MIMSGYLRECVNSLFGSLSAIHSARYNRVMMCLSSDAIDGSLS